MHKNQSSSDDELFPPVFLFVTEFVKFPEVMSEAPLLSVMLISETETEADVF